MIRIAELHPNQIAERLTGRDYLSWSAITSYCACPLRYKLRYMEGLPEESVSASLAYGAAFHCALEYHFRELLAGNPPPSLDSLLAAYCEGWSEYDGREVQFGKGDDHATLGALARRMLEAFQQSAAARPAGILLGIEEELTGELVTGVPQMLARIDLLVDQGDELLLVDFKTARCRWSDDQANESAGQLHLYHELARPIADGRPIKLQFVVATKTKTPEVLPYDIPADPARIRRTLRIVERVWSAVNAGIFYPAPSALHCPGCSFRAACQAWRG